MVEDNSAMNELEEMGNFCEIMKLFIYGDMGCKNGYDKAFWKIKLFCK